MNSSSPRRIPWIQSKPWFLLFFGREHPEHLQGEPRWVPESHLCQWDGDHTQHRTSHPGWGCQPHPGEVQYLPSWRAQLKSHWVEAKEGADQRQHLYIWEKATGKASSCVSAVFPLKASELKSCWNVTLCENENFGSVVGPSHEFQNPTPPTLSGMFDLCLILIVRFDLKT